MKIEEIIKIKETLEKIENKNVLDFLIKTCKNKIDYLDDLENLKELEDNAKNAF